MAVFGLRLLSHLAFPLEDVSTHRRAMPRRAPTPTGDSSRAEGPCDDLESRMVVRCRPSGTDTVELLCRTVLSQTLWRTSGAANRQLARPSGSLPESGLAATRPSGAASPLSGCWCDPRGSPPRGSQHGARVTPWKENLINGKKPTNYTACANTSSEKQHRQHRHT